MAAVLPIVLVAVLAGALAGLLLAELARSREGIWLTKPLASAAFVALAWVWGAADSPYGQLVLAGLALSWVGDVLLVVDDRRAFLAGLAAFLVAHVVYAAAFFTLGVSWAWALPSLVVLSLAAVPIARWLLPHVDAGMRGPVVAYMGVITLMVAFAAGVVASERAVLVVPAAALFYLSDLAVARHRFVTEAFANRLVGLPLYYGAQVLFALSV